MLECIVLLEPSLNDVLGISSTAYDAVETCMCKLVVRLKGRAVGRVTASYPE